MAIPSRRGKIDQRPVVHLTAELIDAHDRRGDVVQGRQLQAFQVTGNGALDRVEARLGRTGDALIGRLQGRNQGRQTAREFGLLIRQAQVGTQVVHQGVVTRARQTRHQLVKLRTLQTDFRQTGFGQGQSGLQGLCQLLTLLGHAARLTRLHTRVLAASGELLLGQIQTLPQQERHNQTHRREQDRQSAQETPSGVPFVHGTHQNFGCRGAGRGGSVIGHVPWILGS